MMGLVDITHLYPLLTLLGFGMLFMEKHTNPFDEI
jgi:hypothetical protein